MAARGDFLPRAGCERFSARAQAANERQSRLRALGAQGGWWSQASLRATPTHPPQATAATHKFPTHLAPRPIPKRRRDHLHLSVGERRSSTPCWRTTTHCRNSRCELPRLSSSSGVRGRWGFRRKYNIWSAPRVSLARTSFVFVFGLRQLLETTARAGLLSQSTDTNIHI